VRPGRVDDQGVGFARWEVEQAAGDVRPATRIVAASGTQRTDSTHVVAAVRDLNRLELAGEAVRACLEALSSAAPRWVAEVLDVPGWSRRYQQRIDTWRLPASQTKKDELPWPYGKDGFALLAAVYAPASPTWLRELPAVGILRVVLVRNYLRIVAGNGREVVKRRGERHRQRRWSPARLSTLDLAL